jgi:Glycine rich protein
MIKSRAMLLAGVSALAMLACAAEANAETFVFTGAVQSFPVLVSGEYSLDVFGASGGNSAHAVGGLGAEVSGDISLTAGETLTLFVGGQGQNGYGGGGGGGGGFVFLGASVLAVAGGGGGGAFFLAVFPDRPGPPAQRGKAPLAGRAARAAAAVEGGPLARALTAAAARVSPPAPPGTGATALALTRDSARNFPMAAPAPQALATAASAAAAAAATTPQAGAGAGCPAAAAVAANTSSASARATVAAAAAPIWRACSPIRS